MRPIIKGDPPGGGTASRNKQRKFDPDFVVASNQGAGKDDLYGMWRGPLIELFGKYCSYCEIPMGTGLQVEHKDPRSQAANPYSSTDWANLLLSCPACNYTKKDHPKGNEDLDDFVWPDGLRGNNNTVTSQAQFSPDPALSTFVYTLHANVAVTMETLDAVGARTVNNLPRQDVVLVTPGNDQAAAARRTIDMLKLNAGYDANSNTLVLWPQASDRRVKHRTLAWKYALAAAGRLHEVNTGCPGTTRAERVARHCIERQITSTAVSAGFWSVWVTVFYQEFAANPSRLTLVQGDTIQKLLGRLFVTGTIDLDLRFPGTEKKMVGVAALGDIPFPT